MCLVSTIVPQTSNTQLNRIQFMAAAILACLVSHRFLPSNKNEPFLPGYTKTRTLTEKSGWFVGCSIELYVVSMVAVVSIDESKIVTFKSSINKLFLLNSVVQYVYF